jgi:hypothetical protein
MVKAAVGRGRRREKKGDEAGKHALLIKLGFHALKYLSVGAQNSVKKGPFWDPSIEGELAREPRDAHPSLTLAHPAREVRVFKAAWCG